MGVFAAAWWGWEVLRLPPTGATRSAVAMAVAAALSTASSGPLFWWAGREVPEGTGAGAATESRAACRPELLAAEAEQETKAMTGCVTGTVTQEIFAGYWSRLKFEVQEQGDLLSPPLTGRAWLAAEIDSFIEQHDRGYFLIEADAGLGKTTFAGWLAGQREWAAHFAQRDWDAGATATVVRSLGAQLIAAWDLAEIARDGTLPSEAGSASWLRTVLEAAARRRDQVSPDMPIVLVVDALDAAADKPECHMPAGLPDRLPSRVYVVATFRTGGLRHVPEGNIHCRLDGTQPENLADLRHYLADVASEGHIARAIGGADLSQAEFITLLAERSLGIWIYVRSVLEEIKGGHRAAGDLRGLPPGLEALYHNSLGGLCDGPDGPELYLPLLATLGAIREPVDAPTMAAFAGVDAQRVQRALDYVLRPYCAVTQQADGPRRFSPYHPSVSEYLSGQGARPAMVLGEGAGSVLDAVTSLRSRLAVAIRDAHQRICDRYLMAWGGLGQGLPGLRMTPANGEKDGGYALRWLTSHLLAAGRDTDLHDLLACGQHRRNAWFTAHDAARDVAGYLRDISRARASTRQLSTQLRYALIEASITSLATTQPPVLVGELVRRGHWTAAQAFSHIERAATEKLRADALAQIASSLPGELLEPALSLAIRCRDTNNRATALRALIPQLTSGDQLERAAGAVLALQVSPGIFLPAMVAVAARLPGSLRTPPPAMSAERRDEVRAANALFSSGDGPAGTRSSLAIAREIDNKYELGHLLAALMPHFPADAFDDVLAVTRTVDAKYLEAPLIALAEFAPKDLLGDILGIAAASGWTAEFAQHAATRFPPDALHAARRLCQDIEVEDDRAETYAALASQLAADEARTLLAPSRHPFGFHAEKVLNLRQWPSRFLALSSVLGQLPEGEAQAIAAELIIPRLQDVPAPFGIDEKSYAVLAPYLNADMRRLAITSICTQIRHSRRVAERYAPFLQRFAPLTLEELTGAFDVVEVATWPEARLMLADLLAGQMPDGHLSYALARATAFPPERECFMALAELARFQIRQARDETAARALALAKSISHEEHRGAAIAALAPILLRPGLATEAFEIARSLRLPSSVQAMNALAPVLPAELLQQVPAMLESTFLSPARWIGAVLQRLSAEGYSAAIDCLLQSSSLEWRLAEDDWLADLAQYLSPLQARRLWRIGPPDGVAVAALSALAIRLPADERPDAVDELLAARAARGFRDDRAAEFLGRLARAASTEQLTLTLRQYLAGPARSRPTYLVLAELADGLPESLIDDALQYAMSDDYDYPLAVAKLAPRLSGPLLRQAIAHLRASRRREGSAAAYAALALQAPSDEPDSRECLSAALESALSWPWRALYDGAFPDLIRQLQAKQRSQAVNVALPALCWELRDGDLSGLRPMLAVLRGAELQQLYRELGQLTNPGIRARAQAAVIRQAVDDQASSLATTVPTDGWPGGFDRAALMELLAASSSQIARIGSPADIDDVIEATFDVARWWP